MAILFPASIAIINAQVVKEQIILDKNNIKSLTGFGAYEAIDPEYVSFYNASNLFDNKINSYSFWSEYGNSGFNLELNQPLNNNVCGVEINVLNPQNTSYIFKINNNTFNGILNTQTVTGDFDPCIKDMTKLSMNFAAPNKWTTLSEVKLFSNETIIIEPPVCQPGTHYDPILKKCVPDVITKPNQTNIVLNNTNVTMTAIDSTLKINLEGDSTVIYLPPPQDSQQQVLNTEEQIEEEIDKLKDKLKEQKKDKDE